MTNAMKIKVLIVFERAGMGHEIMANILEEQLRQDSRFEPVKHAISDMLDDPLGEWLTNVWVSAWNFFIRRNWIELADILINYLMRLILLPIGEVSVVAAMHQALDQAAPDILICTADTAGKCLGTWAQEKQVPFFLVITDLSVFLDLISPNAIHLCYFPETVNAIQSFPLTLTYWSQPLVRSSTIFEKIQFIGKYWYDFVVGYSNHRIYRDINRDYPGQNQVRCQVIGPLREAKHFTARDQQILRHQFQLPTEVPAILIMSGSLGGNFCIKYLRLLQTRLQLPLTIIVACGRDERLRSQIQQMAIHSLNCQVRSLGFVENLQEWMTAVDVILARPSTGVLLEALLSHTPLLLPNRAAANDRGAISFVKKYQLGECFTDANDLKLKLHHLLNDREGYCDRIRVLLKNYPSTVEEHREILQKLLLGSLQH